jgi:hypothetical protein
MCISTHNVLVNKILFIQFVLTCSTSAGFEYYLLIVKKTSCFDYSLSAYKTTIHILPLFCAVPVTYDTYM